MAAERRKGGWPLVAVAVSGLLAQGAVGRVHAHEGPHPRASAAPAEVGRAPANLRLVEAPLLDRQGRRWLFRSQVIADRVVAMTVMYTSCTTVCPVVAAIFEQVQNQLGDKLGREIFLVSVSADPATDTPDRLRRYSARYKARPGWFWLTGAAPDVTRVLDGLGAFTPEFTEHPLVVLIGDGRRGRWVRLFGFPRPEQIVAELDALLAARRQVGGDQ